jgi:hypothetical protein
MFKCEICEREFETLTGLNRHIGKYHKPFEDYYLKYINPVKGKCGSCGKDTKFISWKIGYLQFCCIKCSNSNKDRLEKIKITNLKRYGTEWSCNNEEVLNKRFKTNLERYGTKYAASSKIVIDKITNIFMKKYGVNFPLCSKLIRDKGIETTIIRYGEDNCMKNKGIREKALGTKKSNNFKRTVKRYPYLVLIENLIEGSNGEVLAHCKNSNCKNSKENGGRFEISAIQIQYRNMGINTTSDTNYFYCCEECKKSCILYRSSLIRLNNIFSPEGDLNQASQQDLSIWRNEVFNRQLLENLNHKENFCEICHLTENLVGHHILPQKLYPAHAIDPDNGIVLCEECHTKYGHTKGTECSTGNLANKICK